MYSYNINIFYSKEDEGYIADIPDIQFCSAVGETPEKALEELIIAKQLWLEETNQIKKRPFSELKGIFKGKIWMSDDFDDSLEEMKEYMG